MRAWRFIETEEMSGSFNMSVDEALLDSYIENGSNSVFRLYKWKKPTLTIGRNQNIDEIDVFECYKNGIDIIRRPTGGKAVLHQGEITYSIIAGKKDGISDNIFDSYLQISKALIYGFEKLKKNIHFSIGDSPTTKYTKDSFCFASSTVSDLNYNGKKFVGSAQLRRGNSFLQHGSILIDQDFSLLEKLFIKKQNIESLTNLSEIIGFVPNYEMIKNCILEGLREYFSIELYRDSLSVFEIDLSDRYCPKYKNYNSGLTNYIEKLKCQ